MRKVVFGGANSLDNYFARKDDSVDWLMWSDEVGKIMADYFKSFDTIVMGRRTYEVALRMGHGGATSGHEDVCFLAHAETAFKTKNLEITSEDVAEFVGRIKQEEGKDICIMGGGLLAKSLFEANLIDEIGFNIHPVLLGSGIPLFLRDEPSDRSGTDRLQDAQDWLRAGDLRVKPPGEKKKSTKKKSPSRARGKK